MKPLPEATLLKEMLDTPDRSVNGWPSEAWLVRKRALAEAIRAKFHSQHGLVPDKGRRAGRIWDRLWAEALTGECGLFDHVTLAQTAEGVPVLITQPYGIVGADGDKIAARFEPMRQAGYQFTIIRADHLSWHYPGWTGLIALVVIARPTPGRRRP